MRIEGGSGGGGGEEKSKKPRIGNRFFLQAADLVTRGNLSVLIQSLTYPPRLPTPVKRLRVLVRSLTTVRSSDVLCPAEFRVVAFVLHRVSLATQRRIPTSLCPDIQNTAIYSEHLQTVRPSVQQVRKLPRENFSLALKHLPWPAGFPFGL